MFLNLRLLWTGVALVISAHSITAQAQTKTILTLDSFTANKGSWSEVGQVWTDPTQSREFSAEGSGSIILNAPSKKKPGTDIISKENYGDVELSLTYMLAKGSNSGLYLQGQYEIQLFDSWEETTPRAGGNGGVYERWDESKPDGQKGYQGYAPRQNVSKAPGVWQTLEVSFRAPRFSATGEKTENARFRYIKLNGVTIHEELELFGPTRGALKSTEVAEGPIRIQGDHGPIAIKSLEIQRMNFPAPTVFSINFEVFPGSYVEFPTDGVLNSGNKGTLNSFDDFQSGVSGASMTKFEGTIKVEKEGNYTFDVEVPRGLASLQVGEVSATPELKQGRVRVEKSLQAGEVPYVLWISKPRDWTAQGFSWEAVSEGMWPVSFSKPMVSLDYSSDPIWVDAGETPVLRSFIQLPSRRKISHAVSVSSKAGTHFTYDLNSNQLIRVWRGRFLDATPMWNSRGNGMSVPLGGVTYLNEGYPLLLSTEYTAPQDSVQTKGYQLVGDGDLIFSSKAESGAEVSDHIKLMENGQGLTRSIEVKGGKQTYLIQVAPGKQLKQISTNLYLIEDTGVYLHVLSSGVKPQQGKFESEEAVFLPLSEKLSYALLF